MIFIRCLGRTTGLHVCFAYFVATNDDARDVMSNTRKTALLQRFAGVLVEERAQERAHRQLMDRGAAIQEPSREFA